MNLTEMVDSIVADTNQVIKRNEIIRRVRESITSIHNSAFYPKDAVQDFVDLAGNTHSTFSIPLPTRHRKFIRIAPMTALKVPIVTTQRDNSYKPSSRPGATDYWGVPLVDVYHGAGNKVNVVSSIVPPALFISWYESPEVADPLLQTWLMEAHPQVFIDFARARFLKNNGNTALAASIEQTLYSVDIASMIEMYASAEEI
jgi:hypothetical protein